jgi:catechol 2,3-dioxygenase-like lactoylglutathione lyase family enzyme
MIAYVTIGTNDLERAAAFYDKILGALGGGRGFANDRMVGWSSGQGGMIAVCRPFDGQAASVGNGMMVTLAAKDQAQVQALHALALELGGTDEGAPGPRAGGAFYLAYARDPDGNKLAFLATA